MQRYILFVLGKDTHNLGAYKIYKKCINRRFFVDVYATALEDGHLNSFREIRHKIKHIDMLTENQIAAYDYIFTVVPIYEHKLFRDIHKYIFINPPTHLDSSYFAGDFAFTIRDVSKPLVKNEYCPIEKFNYIKSIPGMATGGPQYQKSNIEKNKSMKILFIDAGHFPIGTKKELAKYVIKIAEACPDYEVRIKPRYLPGDKNTTHRNEEHLYEYLDCIVDIPSNLTLIKKHTELKKELEDVDLVICPEGTSSYEEVILSNKNILIFTNFPSKESILWNEDRIKLFKKIAGKLPCMVEYQNIFKYLPQGIHVNVDMLNHLLYKTDNIENDIIDAMEYIYQQYINKNIFPEKRYYRSGTYLQEMQADCNITWEDIIQRRYQLSLYELVISQIRNLIIDIDYSKIFEYIENTKNIQLNNNNLDEIKIKIQDLLFDIYIENSIKMMKTGYSQSLLCLAFFKKGRFNEMPNKNIKCTAYYNYCKAKLAIDAGDYTYAYQLLDKYFKEVENNLYEITYADDGGVKAMAHYFMGIVLFNLKKFNTAKEHLEKCQNWWNGKHIKAQEYLEKLNRLSVN